MPIAGYTQKLMDDMEQTNRCSVLVLGPVTESIARARIRNAARRLDVRVTTMKIREGSIRIWGFVY